jgi:hypothetical protein
LKGLCKERKDYEEEEGWKVLRKDRKDYGGRKDYVKEGRNL